MANRKLQVEIDRVLKKVEDGVNIFETIWDKVYAATSSSQKEKYEGDLKKEIKKLQRLRDQIKTWQGDSSIKDKTKLDLNRKLIEEKMERFKVCEKETKTKAFSKEGLAQDRTDPKQKAKSNVGNWITEAISKLTEQCEEMEAEIETLNSGKRKKRKDNDEHPRIVEIKDHIQRHQYHMEMLERVLRAVHNETVSPEEVDELKDNVDYYIESNQDHDFYEDLEMYDALNLEVPSSTTTSTTSASNTTSANNNSSTNSSSNNVSSSNNTSSSKKAKSSINTNNTSNLDDEDTNSSNLNISTNSALSNQTSLSSSKKGPSSPRLTKSGRDKHGTVGKLARNTSPKNRRGNNININANHHPSAVTGGTLTSATPTSNLSVNPTVGASDHSNVVTHISPKKYGTVTSASIGKDSNLTANSVMNNNDLNSVTSAVPQPGANHQLSSLNNSAVRSTTSGTSTTTITTTAGKISGVGGRTVTLNGQLNARRIAGSKVLPNGGSVNSKNLHANVVDGSGDFDNSTFNTSLNGDVNESTKSMSNNDVQSNSTNTMFPPISTSSVSNVNAIDQKVTGLETTSQSSAIPTSSSNVLKNDTLNTNVIDSNATNELSSSSNNKGLISNDNLGSSSLAPSPTTVIDGDDSIRIPVTGSQLDVDLAILEGVLQYMPEARVDTTKSPTSITSASQTKGQSDKLRSDLKNPQASPTTEGNMSTMLQQRRHQHQHQDGIIASSPRNPMDVPNSFPSVAAPVFDSREVFQHFDPDTLFFIFYYQQGTYQQYLAASELKRQGWRFHKKYLTWFQRHDEPKISTDEYETGTFIYFDYANVIMDGQGNGWCQRIKSEFRFEYRFLEDEL